MAKTSPTSRTLSQLKDWGFTAQVVERWNPYAKIRQDLFGFADIVAVRPGISGTLYIQCCEGSSHAARREKILGVEAARTVIDAGNKVEVWSWAKRGDRGKRKVWTLRREEISFLSS